MFDLKGTAQNFVADCLEAISGRVAKGDSPVLELNIFGCKCEFSVVDDRIFSDQIMISDTESQADATDLKRVVHKSMKSYDDVPKSAVRQIEFEDCGQDFLHWYLDSNGVVVACKAFQGSFWNGCKVTEIKMGEKSVISFIRKGRTLHLKYPIKNIREINV